MMNHKKIEDWGLGLKAPLIIAGPCSVESEEQLQLIADQMKQQQLPVQLFRAGVWKPRTRPGSFEGLGEEALPWLEIVRDKLKIPIAVEVGNTQHVEQALKAGVEVLWIGARTTVNPFSVQEIAESLRGVEVPVMVKNPVNPDLALWIGALERLHAVGIDKLAAIHRGFTDAYDTRFRNKPNWSMPIHLKREIDGIQVINDPSHICGNRAGLQEVAQRALNFGLDGLMIETHHKPDEAWSDAKQQITPADLKELLQSLSFKKVAQSSDELDDALLQMRQKVDFLDNELLDLLAERFQVIDGIGQHKRERGMAVFQPDRWKAVMQSRIEAGVAKKMSAAFMQSFLFAIHEESIKRQEKQIKAKTQIIPEA